MVLRLVGRSLSPWLISASFQFSFGCVYRRRFHRERALAHVTWRDSGSLFIGGGSMFAALATLGNAGGILMPWVVGWIGDLSSLRWGLAVSGFAPLLMLPLVLVLKSRNVNCTIGSKSAVAME